LDREEYAALLVLIDRTIETSEPRRAEYFRGYRRGIRVRFLGAEEETTRERSDILESSMDSGDQYLMAYACGYQDGCLGRKPEYPPDYPIASRSPA
jgi:hypothetical protein